MRLWNKYTMLGAGGIAFLLAARTVQWWREYDFRNKVVLVAGSPAAFFRVAI